MGCCPACARDFFGRVGGQADSGLSSPASLLHLALLPFCLRFTFFLKFSSTLDLALSYGRYRGENGSPSPQLYLVLVLRRSCARTVHHYFEGYP
jgi:hypothetical protein